MPSPFENGLTVLTQVFPAPVAMLDGADRLTAARLVVPQTGRGQHWSSPLDRWM